MTLRDLDELARRASHAGYASIAAYAAALEKACRQIANAESGEWGRIASDALRGKQE